MYLNITVGFPDLFGPLNKQISKCLGAWLQINDKSIFVSKEKIIKCYETDLSTL